MQAENEAVYLGCHHHFANVLEPRVIYIGRDLDHHWHLSHPTNCAK